MFFYVSNDCSSLRSNVDLGMTKVRNEMITDHQVRIASICILVGNK